MISTQLRHLFATGILTLGDKIDKIYLKTGQGNMSH